tara:strand:- start:4609 stop:5091 length:483 start_codon:yes stop_codon:yes gene_type:complete
MGFGSWIRTHINSVGKKASGIANSAISIGKKVAGQVGAVAKKVSSAAGSVAKGAGIVGAGAAALGLEPIAGASLAVAGGAKAVQSGANLVGGAAGDVNRGLSRASGVVASAGQIGQAAMRGNIKGAVSSGVALSKSVGRDIRSGQKQTRATIERAKQIGK